MHVFRSDHHKIFTNYMRKVALSHFDDKRFLIPNSTKTLAWGHKNIHDISETTESSTEMVTEASEDLLDEFISLIKETTGL